jgi:putative membrane protein
VPVDAGAVISLVVAEVLYLRAVRVLATRGYDVPFWQQAAWHGGILLTAIGLLSPIDHLGEELLSAHMAQHLLIVLAAGPLLALGRAELVLLLAMPRRVRRAVGRLWRRMSWLRALARVAALPTTAWLAHMAAIWAWHTPRLYDAAAASEPVHLLEHAMFLVTAVLFARPLLAPTPRAALAPGAAVLYLFAAAMASGVLGALLTLAGTPWYTAHLATTGPWGLTPLEDQQIAGGIMWGPAGAAYFAAMLLEARRMLVDAERASSRPRAQQVLTSR